MTRARRVLTSRLRLAVALWIGSLMAGLLAVAWIVAEPSGWTAGSVLPLVLDMLAIVVLIGALTIMGKASRTWLGEGRVARAMDDSAGLSPGSVLSSLELARDVPAGISEALARHAEGRVLQRLDAAPTRPAAELWDRTVRWARGGLVLLAISLPLLAVLSLASPDRTRSSLIGLAAPIAVLTGSELGPLVITPGSVEVTRGGPVEITVEAGSRREVRLHWKMAGEVRKEENLAVQGGKARFRLTAVEVPVEYWASAGDGSETPRYLITPMDPLFLVELYLELTYPPHTGRAAETVPGDVDSLSIPMGTRIEIEGRASRSLSWAGLRSERESGGGVELRVVGDRFEGELVPGRSGSYLWTFRDVDFEEPRPPLPPLHVALVPDSPPSLEFLSPARDTTMPVSMKKALALRVRDDYGITRAELVVHRVMAGTGQGPEEVLQLPAPGPREMRIESTLDASRWGLMPGDSIRYFARARDNSPAGQWGRTPTYSMWIHSADDAGRVVQDRLDAAASEIEALAERAARAQRETRDLRQRGRGRESESGGVREGGRSPEAPLSFEEREELRRVLNDHRGLTGDVDDLGEELGGLAGSLRDAGLADADLRSDLRELQELLKEISRPQMRERLEEMAAALQDMNRREAEEAARTLEASQEELRKQLEASLDRFRQAAAEQDLRAAARKAEALAREQDLAADALREGGEAGDRARWQDSLTRQARDLGERLEDLGSRFEDLGDQRSSEATAEARERARVAESAMEEAASRVRAEERRTAGEAGRAAARSMEEAARGLQEAGEEMREGRAERVRGALERATDEALALARRQAELRQEMRGASGASLQELLRDEAAVLEGTRRLAETVGEALGQAPGATWDVSRSLGGAMSAIQETIQGLEGSRAPGETLSGAAEEAVQALNQVALSAMAILQGDGAESEAAVEQLMEQLESLAQQQGSVAEGVRSLAPLELGGGAGERQLQELARDQQTIADDLDQLARQPGAGEGAQGDLEGMAREARELAQRLGGGRLEPEMLRRQERLFHRLLDAGRTLERDEDVQERESRTAGEVAARDVPSLTVDALNVPSFPVPGAEELQRLPPAQRQMVLDYFERLNRALAAERASRNNGGRR